MLSFFHLVDETDLDRWQSGLERADGSHRPSYDVVKQTLAQTHGNCPTKPTAWRHLTAVVLPSAAWGEPQAPAAEAQPLELQGRRGGGGGLQGGDLQDRTVEGGARKRLATGRPKPVLLARGVIKATGRLVYFPQRRLKPGTYVYAIRMTATMNSARASVLVSKPFRVGPRR
jgi:hypothetical protein